MASVPRKLIRLCGFPRRMSAIGIGDPSSSAVLALVTEIGVVAKCDDDWLGLYLYVLWPVLLCAGGLLTGSLMPAPRAHPGLESFVCSPGVWVIVLLRVLRVADFGNTFRTRRSLALVGWDVCGIDDLECRIEGLSGLTSQRGNVCGAAVRSAPRHDVRRGCASDRAALEPTQVAPDAG